MPIVKRSLTRSPKAFVFDAMTMVSFPTVTLGAGVVNSNIQGYILLPVACKIPIVAVYCTAIDSLAGTDSFNIVVTSTGYTQGSVASADNSELSVTASGVTPTGGFGYPTLYGVAGNALFSADQQLTTTSGVGVASTTGQPSFGTQTLASGGVWRFVPTVYDAVYQAGTPLTLRVNTTAGTGSLQNFTVSMALSPVFTRGQLPYYTDTVVTPGVDF